MSDEAKYQLYCHTNLVNGKFYFGVTSRGWEARWSDNKYRQNKALNSDILKFGDECWKHEVIVEGLSEKEAARYETAYINFFDATDPEKGYNLSTGGGGLSEHTDDTCIKIAESIRGKWKEREFREAISRKKSPRTSEQREKARNAIEKNFGRKVLCVETGVEYLTIAAAARSVGMEAKPFKKACQRQKTVRGLHWRFCEQSVNQRSVQCVETGEIFQSLRAAAEKNYTLSSSICEVCQGHRKTAGGLHWRYIDEK